MVKGGTRIQRCFAACGTARRGSCSAVRQQQGAERTQPSPLRPRQSSCEAGGTRGGSAGSAAVGNYCCSRPSRLPSSQHCPATRVGELPCLLREGYPAVGLSLPLLRACLLSFLLGCARALGWLGFAGLEAAEQPVVGASPFFQHLGAHRWQHGTFLSGWALTAPSQPLQLPVPLPWGPWGHADLFWLVGEVQAPGGGAGRGENHGGAADRAGQPQQRPGRAGGAVPEPPEPQPGPLWCRAWAPGCSPRVGASLASCY